jgi:hypothetical protein
MRKTKLVVVMCFLVVVLFSFASRTRADFVSSVPPVQGTEPFEPIPRPTPTPSPITHGSICRFLGYCVCGIYG